MLVTFPAPARGAAVFKLRARGASGAQERAGLQQNSNFSRPRLQFKNRPQIMEDYADLLSLVEMELSFLSSFFVYSCYSTWR